VRAGRLNPGPYMRQKSGIANFPFLFRELPVWFSRNCVADA
jgi:hypothetical protein